MADNCISESGMTLLNMSNVYKLLIDDTSTDDDDKEMNIFIEKFNGDIDMDDNDIQDLLDGKYELVFKDDSILYYTLLQLHYYLIMPLYNSIIKWLRMEIRIGKRLFYPDYLTDNTHIIDDIVVDSWLQDYESESMIDAVRRNYMECIRYFIEGHGEEKIGDCLYHHFVNVHELACVVGNVEVIKYLYLHKYYTSEIKDSVVEQEYGNLNYHILLAAEYGNLDCVEFLHSVYKETEDFSVCEDCYKDYTYYPKSKEYHVKDGYTITRSDIENHNYTRNYKEDLFYTPTHKIIDSDKVVVDENVCCKEYDDVCRYYDFLELEDLYMNNTVYKFSYTSITGINVYTNSNCYKIQENTFGEDIIKHIFVKPTVESRHVECVKFLMKHNYPISNCNEIMRCLE